MTGTVITFYSYKGGVGRSFALANVAVLLARWGYRVLTVDWDLEAPGLHHYFKPVLPHAPAGGVVDLADDFLARKEDPAKHTIQLELEEGTVALLAAGRQDAAYTGRVQGIDWADLYQRGFATFLERCRAEWTASYDFVLIDSRTGISDIGGICTAHLPDRLVVVFTANEQSVQGAVDIARRADLARDRMPYDRPRHLVLPILSRLDNRMEYKRAEQWQRRCTEIATPLFRNWLAQGVPEEQMLRHLTLPYVSYWSFGEELPVRVERTPSSDQISFALETVAAVIAHRFDRTDLLADNRDAYVAATRHHRHGEAFGLDLLVSTRRSTLNAAAELVEALQALGLRTARSVSSNPEFLEQPQDPARHLCLLVDQEVSRWQVTEAERFLRRTLSQDGDERQLFCVLTPDTSREQLPGFLRNLQHLEFDVDARPTLVARQLRDLITGTQSGHAESDANALRTAARALRNVPNEMPYLRRWTLIQQTLRGMTAALDGGDLALFRDLTVDLELLSQVHANGDRFAAPHDLRAEIGALVDRIDRRVHVQ